MQRSIQITFYYFRGLVLASVLALIFNQLILILKLILDIIKIIHMSLQPNPQISSSKSSQDRIYFQLMERVGTFGRYQKLTLVFWCIIGYLTGGAAMIAPFVFFQDQYQCPQDFKGQSCDDFVCSLNSDQRKSYLGDITLQTAANSFQDYHCGSDYLYIGVLQLIIYSSLVIGYIILSIIGEKFGRKLLLMSNIMIALLGLLLCVFSINIQMVAAGMFLTILGSMNSMEISFVYIAEIMSEQYRDRSTSIVMFFEQIGGLMNVGGFFLLGNYKLVILYFYLIPVAIVTIIMFIYLVDTPIRLITHNTPQQALYSFQKIARINNAQTNPITIQEIIEVKNIKFKQQNQQKENTSFSLLSLFSFASLRYSTICLSLLDMAVNFLYFAPVLMMDKFNLNIFVNGLVISASSLIASILSIMLVKKAKRKLIFFVNIGICLICSIILIFVWDQNSQQQNSNLKENIGQYILIFCFRFAITLVYNFFQVYINEIYPSQVRIVGTSFICCMGGVMSTFTPFILSAAVQSNFKIMVIFAIFSLSGIFSNIYLPQTLGIPPPDVIEQLRANLKKPSEQKKYETQQDLPGMQTAANIVDK